MVALARVSRGYMVCARARVTWLHGLRDGQRSPHGEISSAKTRIPHVGIYLDRVKMNVAQYHVWPDPRASTLVYPYIIWSAIVENIW